MTHEKSALAKRLAGADPRIKALIGLDGFVDEVVHVVDKRTGIDDFIRLESMAEYGRRIAKSAGLSTNIEMVTVQQKLGGNGPIFANALIAYGMDLTYIGALGVPDIHPIFKEMVSGCRAISIADPARTDAIEFFDGKIISSKLETFKEVNWKSIREKVGIENLVKMIDECRLVGFENWTMVHYMSEIFEHILSEVLPKLSPKEDKPVIFFDLADPEKREPGDIAHALDLIGQFASHFSVVLGLNKKEACEIAELLGMKIGSYNAQKLSEMAEYIYAKIHVEILFIHPTKEAYAISREGCFHVQGPYCKQPKLTTGAGDNFNAGFIFGIAAGFGIKDSLILGTATSGFYVRKARSPKLPEIMEFLQNWENGVLD
jgi:hypothetical protein